jgi:hypothetical protein
MRCVTRSMGTQQDFVVALADALRVEYDMRVEALNHALANSRGENSLSPDRVIAATDCGLGLRCHPQIAWATATR